MLEWSGMFTCCHMIMSIETHFHLLLSRLNTIVQTQIERQISLTPVRRTAVGIKGPAWAAAVATKLTMLSKTEVKISSWISLTAFSVSATAEL